MLPNLIYVIFCGNGGTIPPESQNNDVIPDMDYLEHQWALTACFSGIDCESHQVVAGFCCWCPSNQQLRAGENDTLYSGFSRQ
jgi:hypothetical protein